VGPAGFQELFHSIYKTVEQTVKGLGDTPEQPKE